MRRISSNKKLKELSLSSIMLLSLGIFLSTVLFRPILSDYLSQQQKVKTEETSSTEDEQSSDTFYFEVADQAVVLVLGINLTVASRFLFEFDFTILEATYATFQCCPALLKYYISIFSHFIVVNAP